MRWRSPPALRWRQRRSSGQAEVAIALGAEASASVDGAHVLEGDRIDAVRERFSPATRRPRAPLAKPCPYRRATSSHSCRDERTPVTIRLLDPPLHEFLPHTEEESAAWRKKIGVRQTTHREVQCAARGKPNAWTGAAGWESLSRDLRMQVQASWKPSASSARESGRSEIMIRLSRGASS